MQLATEPRSALHPDEIFNTGDFLRRRFPSLVLGIFAEPGNRATVTCVVPHQEREPVTFSINDVHHARHADRMDIAGRILRAAYPKGWAVA